MANESIMTEFQLMGFSDDHDMQILHFVIFLIIYLLALMGNVLLLVAVVLNQHLHSPMYFFLVNLSISDVCFISTTIPKAMAASLTNNREISYVGCAAQVFSVLTFAGSELALLTVMAYDRYVAICHPLQYTLMVNWDACLQMAAASWISTLIHALLHTILTFRLNFCKFNRIEQFFCDIPHLLMISCTDIRINQILILVIVIIVDSFCSGLIFISYGYIFLAVLKVPSVQGRYKAFSTCTPHLTVFSLFFISALFAYMRPQSLSSHTLDLLSAVLYTVLPPLLNPLIYSFRNKDIQKAVWRMLNTSFI
ncbi:olfactory receptor 14A16-like [Protobothrops mucrosquamatus]|uniref:olfactory receptor 14A16-like n=1 Tax=Protobothrops mucrosquamatus TaxID=103944 RepID=UPI000775D550|nr:olfactory receptor 14A16-like [Protobothrops mucrosquamatus]